MKIVEVCLKPKSLAMLQAEAFFLGLFIATIVAVLILAFLRGRFQRAQGDD